MSRAAAEERDDAEPQRVVVRDKRRIDPDSGSARHPGAADAASSGPDAPGPVLTAVGGAEEGRLAAELEERTRDLQRLKAEYDNYRKRVERDRLAVLEQAAGRVLSELLPLLDDVDRARRHGELTGGFKSVAETLESTLSRLGLERFGAPGDSFDPQVHEAVAHLPSAEATGPTCAEVLRPGYSFAGRLLRPAMVAVADVAQEEPAEVPQA